MSRGFLQLAALITLATFAGAFSAAGTAPHRALPGDLPRPLADLTSGELFDVGNQLRFDNGPVQDRACARGACKGRVDAVRDQTPGPGVISPNGTIVARLVNLGGDGGRDEGAEDRYRTGRGQREFYIIALRDGTGWRWTVREAVRNGGGVPLELANGGWATCRHDGSDPGHPKGRSQFASCTGPADADDAPIRGAGPSVAHAAGSRASPLDPAWVQCLDGCCTAGQ